MATTFTRTGGRTQTYGRGRSRKIVVGDMVTDGNDGAAALDIPASVFGLTKLEESSHAVKSDNSLLVATQPTVDGLSLLGKAAASAAAADIPAGTYRITLRGY